MRTFVASLLAAIALTGAAAAAQSPPAYGAKAKSPWFAADPRFGQRGFASARLGDARRDSEFVDVTGGPHGTIYGLARVWRGRPALQTFAVVRFLASGALDGHFGSRGRVIGGPLAGRRVVPLNFARIDGGVVVLASVTRADASESNVLVKLDGSGQVDPAFGHHGVYVLDFPLDTAIGERATVKQVAVGPAESIYVAAELARGDGGDPRVTFGVLRLNKYGSPLAAFGAGGLARFAPDEFPGFTAELRMMLVQPDGGVALTALGSKIPNTNPPQTAPVEGCDIVRLTPGGALDASLFGDGTVLIGFWPQPAPQANHIDCGRFALTAGGGYAVLERHMRDGEFRFDNEDVMRTIAAGDVDPSFSGDGWLEIPQHWPAQHVALSDLVVRGDGRVLVLGENQYVDKPSSNVAVLVTPQGDFDRAFGSSGVADFAPAGKRLHLTRLALADRYVVAAGTRGHGKRHDAVLVRVRL